MSSKRAILLFIPGNPGIETYYTSFFATLRTLHPDLEIHCHPHLGFGETDVRRPGHFIDLEAQVAHKVDLLESILLGLKSQNAQYSSEAQSQQQEKHKQQEKNVPIYLAGHSVGAYMAIKLLQLRPDVVQRVYLLFPTLSHIAKSKQGVVATHALRVPLIIPVLTGASWMLRYLVPKRWRQGLVSWFTRFPADAVEVTSERVLRPSAVYTALTLARSEMEQIRDPDETFWSQYAARSSAYWARNDNWVSNEHRTELLALAKGMESYHCEQAPHAFCIRHGDVVAEKMSEWLTRDIERYYSEPSGK